MTGCVVGDVKDDDGSGLPLVALLMPVLVAAAKVGSPMRPCVQHMSPEYTSSRVYTEVSGWLVG